MTMTVGFTLAAIIIGWTDGSYNLIIEKFTRAYLGHIQIHYQDYLEQPTLYKNIDNYREVGKKLDELQTAESWAPRLYAAGLVSVGEKSTVGQIIGIDPILENKATGFHKQVKKGKTISKTPAKQVVIGKVLAKTLNASIGDTLYIVSQAADGSIANDMYKIIGIVESDDQMKDRMAIYMHLYDAQKLMVLENRVHEIVVMVEDINKVDEVVSQIENSLNNSQLNVLPWMEVNKSFYATMQMDKESNNILSYVVMLIVGIGVLNTVLMAVLERTREFGVLKALGTRPLQIFILIIVEVLIMTIASIVLGAILGTAANYALSHYGIKMPVSYDLAGVTFDTLISEVNLKSIVFPSVLVILAALLVSLFPAVYAAKTEPAKTMRFH